MKTFNASLNELQVLLKTRGQLATTYPTKKSPVTTCLYCIPNKVVLDHDRAKTSSIPLGEANLAGISPKKDIGAKLDFQIRSQRPGMAWEKLTDQQQQRLILKSNWGFSALKINKQPDKQKNTGWRFDGKWNPWIYQHPPPSTEDR